VEKNVLIQASSYFLDDTKVQEEFIKSWTEVIRSTNTIEYNTKWSSFQQKYSSYPALIQYVTTTWITPWKKLIVYAWTDQYRHFGHHATSRVEGSHKTIKGNLQVSTGDLKTVYNKITMMLLGQYSEHDAAVDSDRSRTPHAIKGPFYEQLLSRISHYALGRLWNQQYRLKQPKQLPHCTELFTKSMGLPCAHIMQQKLYEGITLTLEDIHSHWHLHTQAPLIALPLVLEPAVTVPKGRPRLQTENQKPRENRVTRNRKALSFTRRDLSTFERIPKPPTRVKKTRPKQSKKAQTTREKAKAKASTLSGDEFDDGHDSEEDALMLRELERLKASDGQALPLWALEPEFVTMSNATRSFALRGCKE